MRVVEEMMSGWCGSRRAWLEVLEWDFLGARDADEDAALHGELRRPASQDELGLVLQRLGEVL
jgi:hypothetical protein